MNLLMTKMNIIVYLRIMIIMDDFPFSIHNPVHWDNTSGITRINKV